MYSCDVLSKVTFYPKRFITKVAGVILDTLMYSGDVRPKGILTPK